MRAKRMTYPNIHKFLSEKGYTGSVASLRMFMQKERTRMSKSENQEMRLYEFVQQKSLWQLIYKKIEQVMTITPEQYEEVVKKHPILGKLYSLIKEFYEVLFSKKADKLKPWMESAKTHDIPELQSFAEGISRDFTAEKNAIIYSYSNGLAEGSVNKIKVIKRITYGKKQF